MENKYIGYVHSRSKAIENVVGIARVESSFPLFCNLYLCMYERESSEILYRPCNVKFRHVKPRVEEEVFSGVSHQSMRRRRSNRTVYPEAHSRPP